MPICAAPMPADVDSLIRMLPEKSDGLVPYREEARHPAFAEPEVATGVLSVKDGRLIREQRFPEAESAAIGDTVVSVTTPGTPEPNILPIPPEMRPLLQTLRAILTRDPASMRDRAELVAAPDNGGWILTFPDLDQRVGMLRVTGCGARIGQIDVSEPSGIRRTMILGAPE